MVILEFKFSIKVFMESLSFIFYVHHEQIVKDQKILKKDEFCEAFIKLREDKTTSQRRLRWGMMYPTTNCRDTN